MHVFVFFCLQLDDCFSQLLVTWLELLASAFCGRRYSPKIVAAWHGENIFSFHKEASLEPVADDSGKGPVAGHGVARPVAVAAGGDDTWPAGGSLQQMCK